MANVTKTGALPPTMPETFRLRIEYRKIDDLQPYAGNARTHTDKQIAQVAASIRQFGFTNPVLIDCKRGIVAGHGRVASWLTSTPRSYSKPSTFRIDSGKVPPKSEGRGSAYRIVVTPEAK